MHEETKKLFSKFATMFSVQIKTNIFIMKSLASFYKFQLKKCTNKEMKKFYKEHIGICGFMIKENTYVDNLLKEYKDDPVKIFNPEITVENQEKNK